MNCFTGAECLVLVFSMEVMEHESQCVAVSNGTKVYSRYWSFSQAAAAGVPLSSLHSPSPRPAHLHPVLVGRMILAPWTYHP